MASLAFGLAALVLSAGGAQATLFEIDWKVAADGLVTFDSETNLDWLDLTQSQGRSYNDVIAQFGLGGDFEGFRHGASAEVAQLWLNAGIVEFAESGSGGSILDGPNVESLLQLTGETASNPPRSRGILQEDFAGSNNHIIALLEYSVPVGKADLNIGFAPDGTPQGNIGHWLVREHVVPEPTTAWLLIAALSVCCRRSQRRQGDSHRHASSRAAL